MIAVNMELRDWFAGQALLEMVRAARAQPSEDYSTQAIAKWSYDVADAMLAARENRESDKPNG